MIGGTAAEWLNVVATYAGYEGKDVELTVDDEVSRVVANTIVVANCKYFDGGVRVAPDASPDDHVFDVVVIGTGLGPPVVEGPAGRPPQARSRVERAAAKLRTAGRIPGFYRGTHVRDESVMVIRGAKVRVESRDHLVLRADGDVIGLGPLEADVVQDALAVIA